MPTLDGVGIRATQQSKLAPFAHEGNSDSVAASHLSSVLGDCVKLRASASCALARRLIAPLLKGNEFMTGIAISSVRYAVRTGSPLYAVLYIYVPPVPWLLLPAIGTDDLAAH